jgi:hypothetical protein
MMENNKANMRGVLCDNCNWRKFDFGILHNDVLQITRLRV